MLLILVDDQPVPFWKNWPSSTWDGFEGPKEIFDVEPSNLYMSMIGECKKRVDEACKSHPGPYCIVTDAMFGDEIGVDVGGINLLNHHIENHNDRFVRGCVYSITPGDERKLLNTERCKLITLESNQSTEIARIMAFLRTGVLATNEKPQFVEPLTRAIHALHNLPIRIDVQTLGTLAERKVLGSDDQCLFKEIVLDNFGGDVRSCPSSLEDQIGKISKERDFPGGQAADTLITEVRSARERLFAGVNLDESEFWSDQERLRCVYEAMKSIVERIDALIEQLRAARKGSKSPA